MYKIKLKAIAPRMNDDNSLYPNGYEPEIIDYVEIPVRCKDRKKACREAVLIAHQSMPNHKFKIDNIDEYKIKKNTFNQDNIEDKKPDNTKKVRKK